MPTQTRPRSIDPAVIARITREVIARMGQATAATADATESPDSSTPDSPSPSPTTSIDDPVVTTARLGQLANNPSQLFIHPAAIVTPAAADEARRRGITIRRTDEFPDESPPQPQAVEITDSTHPDRAESVRRQLELRGVRGGPAQILLSDTPARDVYRLCSGGEVAVMINTVTDASRFATELSPTAWVLDMQRLNIPAAVNVIAQIARLRRSS